MWVTNSHTGFDRYSHYIFPNYARLMDNNQRTTMGPNQNIQIAVTESL